MALAGRALASPSDEATHDETGLDDRELLDGSGEEIARSLLDVGNELLDDSLTVMSGLVDVTSYQDLELRHRHPSPWGRLDLALAWRRTDRTPRTVDALVAMPGEPARRDEVWLVATWSN